jgi:LysR family transcriptional regulator, regulator for metE and metH
MIVMSCSIQDGQQSDKQEIRGLFSRIATVSSLDRSHYQLLVALDRRGTITAAAGDLFITQSAASQRLREAERRLGFPLITRHGRTVALTPAAQRLVQAAHVSERALGAAEADARWLGSSREPALQLAVDVHDVCWWLPSVLARLNHDPRAATIELVRSLAGDGLTMVLDSRADAVITPGASAVAPRARPLFDDPLVAVVANTHPLAHRATLTPEDFVDADYATYSTTPQAGFEHATFFAPRRVWPKRILRLESISALLDVVAAGRWTSVLPRWTVPAGRSIVTIPLEPSPPPISWSLVTRNLDDHPPLDAAASHLTTMLRNLTQNPVDLRVTCRS